ncbi:uncharacterized protein [Blastocystis hominis]|uniref:Uncharacterized protein n=1 Tax=Blastocystis hominis TaxID=12968 RepID=D8M2U6_BLAHO|nr:uncharacterized protein [Blastocystis hominis]CBK22669.2 unnamed protein product [Blastocystis hominis]|eukprot:XP_012896717.1 uncharacterized protein [Blastocystis hominis]
MSSGQNRRWKKPEEPDWRTRENRGHTWFTNMKREKEKKNQGTKFCQRCYSTDHYTYECKNERVYQVRPSETQQLKHPKLVRPLTTELPPDVLEKQQKERDALIKQSEALLEASKKNGNGNQNESDSYSDYSYSYSYSYSKPDEKATVTATAIPIPTIRKERKRIRSSARRTLTRRNQNRKRLIS